MASKYTRHVEKKDYERCFVASGFEKTPATIKSVKDEVLEFLEMEEEDVDVLYVGVDADKSEPFALVRVEDKETVKVCCEKSREEGSEYAFVPLVEVLESLPEHEEVEGSEDESEDERVTVTKKGFVIPEKFVHFVAVLAAKGFIRGEKFYERAKTMAKKYDEKYHIVEKTNNWWKQIDEKYKVKERAKSFDEKYKVKDKAEKLKDRGVNVYKKAKEYPVLGWGIGKAENTYHWLVDNAVHLKEETEKEVNERRQDKTKSE